MRIRSICLLAMVSTLQAAPVPVTADIDWSEFLKRHDLVWDQMDEPWYHAPFVGNGELGSMMRVASPEQILLDVGSSRVHDHRTDDLRNGVVPRSIEVFNRGRLPVGHFELKPVRPITPAKSTARVSLWDAEATGGWNVAGETAVSWRLLAHAEENVAMLELRAPANQLPAIRFVPAEARSPREFPELLAETWVPNPPVREIVAATQGVAHQKLATGGETVTAWRFVRLSPDVLRLFWTVVHVLPGEDASPLTLAKEALDQATEAKYDEWLASHRAWWHAYYPQSFLSFGDPYWEAYYWAQMYKIASATRADRPLIDNAGPWFQPTANWAAAWWNMNVQFSYSPVYTANRLHLGESLVRHYHDHQENLTLSVDGKYRHDSAGLARTTGPNLLGWSGEPGGRAIIESEDVSMETGNLLWVCHNLWLHYAHSMDEKISRDTLFPILRRAVNFHRHFLEPGADGTLHLPVTYSPEYGAAPDASFDLALLRWGAATLMDLNRALKLEDPLAPKWQEVLEKLTPYSRDQKSYHIGKGVPYATSQRHGSHLLMIYPLREVRPDNNDIAWIRSNLAHWHSLPQRFMGHSYSNGASIAAITGDRDRFSSMLGQFKKFVEPNTFYRSGSNPVMESPLHMACAIQEAFLQSHHDHLAIFPCVPNAWPNASFHRFLAQGGHLVSAAMKNGKPAWVDIESPHGGTLVISVPFASDPHLVTNAGGEMSIHDDGKIEVTLAPGSRCQITVKPMDAYQIQPVPALPGAANPFGLKAK